MQKPERLLPSDLPEAATLHAACFEDKWDVSAIETLLAGSGVQGWIWRDEAGVLAGFLLVRFVADEAEILTLAVAPASRRQGIGQVLVEALLFTARKAGIKRVFLEVATDNLGAIALYAQNGFQKAGRRPGYYRTSQGLKDALLLSRDLKD